MKKSLLGLSVALAAFAFGVSTVGLFVQKQPFLIVKEGEKIESAVVKQPLSGNQPYGTVETEEVTSEPIKPETIYGWYSPKSYRKMPEVDMILLSVNGEYDEDYAGIYTQLSDDIDEGFAEAIKPIITKDKVKFTTKKVKGVEYRFEGTFFKNKTVGEQDEEIMRGTLQKYIKGKKVAEINGNFTYSEPFCLR